MNHDLSNKKEIPEIREWTDIRIKDNMFSFREIQIGHYSYCHNSAFSPKIKVDANFDEVVLEFSKFLIDTGSAWIKIK